MVYQNFLIQWISTAIHWNKSNSHPGLVEVAKPWWSFWSKSSLLERIPLRKNWWIQSISTSCPKLPLQLSSTKWDSGLVMAAKPFLIPHHSSLIPTLFPHSSFFIPIRISDLDVFLYHKLPRFGNLDELATDSDKGWPNLKDVNQHS